MDDTLVVAIRDVAMSSIPTNNQSGGVHDKLHIMCGIFYFPGIDTR